MLDELYRKIGPLEAAAHKSALMRTLTDMPWLPYLALAATLVAALLQAAERAAEERSRGQHAPTPNQAMQRTASRFALESGVAPLPEEQPRAPSDAVADLGSR